MVYVCDAIMGSGKSQSAIAYMNARPDRKFIYISPYLEESARIRRGCPALRFIEPSCTPEHGLSKSYHTMELIRSGRNITSTHQAFTYYTQETLQSLRDHEYTLIVDENMSVLQTFDFSADDLEACVRAGYIQKEGDMYFKGEVEYGRGMLSPIIRLIQSRVLERVRSRGDCADLHYWALPPDLFNSFKDVFVLTYLFEGQELSNFLHMHDIGYRKIGIRRTADGGYEFSETQFDTPSYVSRLGDYIHICDNPRLNAIGENEFDLSKNWFLRKPDAVAQLKKNIYNYFRNVMKDFPSSQRMWGTMKSGKRKLEGPGYTSGYVVFNSKATNEYRHKRVLAYAVNVYMNVGLKRFYEKHGIAVDEDRFALSTMIQWIWRSAIRDGHEIWIYVPSRRMRTLLETWIQETSAAARDAAVSGGGEENV